MVKKILSTKNLVDSFTKNLLDKLFMIIGIV